MNLHTAGIRAMDAEPLKQDGLAKLTRAQSSEGESYLLKASSTEYPDSEIEELIRSEYALFESMDSSRILKPVTLARIENRVVAVYDDREGSLLDADFRGPMALSAFLPSALEMCDAIDEFHRRGYALLNLGPGSFLRHPETGKLTLVDALLAREAPFSGRGFERTLLAGGSYQFCAPEAFGMAGASVSRRADLYSLGVLFHLGIVGCLPFQAEDPAEIIQAHLAMPPPEPSDFQDGVPQELAGLICRLMAKSPAERPRDIGEVKAALDALATRPSAPPPAQDRPSGAAPWDSLQAKVYGRQAEIRYLESKLGALSGMTPELVLIEGEAGVGKTALAAELREKAARMKGVFCGGKFDQTNGSNPFGIWVTVLESLADPLLMQSPQDLKAWKQAFESALGNLAGPLVGLAPRWRNLLGKASAIPEFVRETDVNRVALALQRLLECIAERESSVILFLDDLQWADATSLRILKVILSMPSSPPFLVLGTVRTGQETHATGFSGLIPELERLGVPVDRFELGPIGKGDLEGMLNDAFAGGLADSGGLAELLIGKTGGNPFFAREFLRAQGGEGIFAYDQEQRIWTWDMHALETRSMTENVIDFVTEKMDGMQPDIRETIAWAACLAPEFRISDFLRASSMKRESAVRLLAKVVQEGILSERDGGSGLYRFTHDRLLEGGIRLLPPEERSARHLMIGRRLSEGAGEGANPVDEIRVAVQLNAASALIADPGERLATAGLNFRAGKAAMGKMALSQAGELFQAGLGFLRPVGGEAVAIPESEWVSQRQLCIGLHEEGAAVALLNADFGTMRELSGPVIAHSRSPLEKVRACELRILGFIAEKEFGRAVDAGLEMLSDLGIYIPPKPSKAGTLLRLLGTWRRLAAFPPAKLVSLPPMSDPRMLGISRIIQTLYSAAFLGRPELFPRIVFCHVNLSLNHGNEEYSAVTYTAFAVVLCALGRYDSGLELASIAMELLKRMDADKLKIRVYPVMYGLIFPFKHPLREGIRFLWEGYQKGLQYGEFEFASYLITMHGLASFNSGIPLGELHEAYSRHRQSLATMGQVRSTLFQDLLTQTVSDLRSLRPGERPLQGSAYGEDEALDTRFKPMDHNLAFTHFISKTIICLIFGRSEEAVAAVLQGRVHMEGAFGSYEAEIFVFYETLAWLLAPSVGRSRIQRSRRIAANRRRMRKLSQAGPANFFHKHHLIEALHAQESGRPDRASEHFEKAIQHSQEHGFLHETALAQEFSAEFYFQRGMDRLGRYFLRESLHSYRNWGAQAKVDQMLGEHRRHLGFLEDKATASAGLSGFPEMLDYRMVLKSSQAIAGETLLSSLLSKLLRIILRHAGAEKGYLLVEKDGRVFAESAAQAQNDRPPEARNEPLEDGEKFPLAIVQYTARTGEATVLNNAGLEGPFKHHPYVVTARPKSVLCLPLLHQGKTMGLIYLENSHVTHLFSEERVEILKLLAAQAAISMANAQYHALQLEIRQAKINPHFLFNTLSSIADLIVDDAPAAETAVVKLSNLYRYILTSSEASMVPLEQEIEVVRTYLQLEKMRFGSRLDFSLELEGDIGRIRLPGLLIQPLVENSIRHGIGPKTGPGKVAILASAGENECRIVVEDDGDGVSSVSSGTGYGLRSVQERLKLAYGDRYSLGISRTPGFRVEITIPVLI
jgi:predicted ATPase/GAF domain-containing protein